MSEYKAPEPEMHLPDPGLDIRPEKTVWYIGRNCECGGIILSPGCSCKVETEHCWFNECYLCWWNKMHAWRNKQGDSFYLGHSAMVHPRMNRCGSLPRANREVTLYI